VSLDWLIFGKGEPKATSQPSAAYRVDDGALLPAPAGPGPGMAAVALYDVEGAAGDGRSLEGERIEGELYFPEAQLAALGVSPGQVAGIKVRGDSMEGTLDDGDWVLVDLANRDPRRSGVFLLWQSGERRIKRVQRLPGGALQLISDNTHYPPEMIRPEEMRDVEILGRCEVRIGRVS
jgi:phage repressor protein C with HTH and peptisase S24 domain